MYSKIRVEGPHMMAVEQSEEIVVPSLIIGAVPSRPHGAGGD